MILEEIAVVRRNDDEDVGSALRTRTERCLFDGALLQALSCCRSNGSR